MPYLEKLIAREEKAEEKERKFTLSRLWIDNRSMIKVYACLFFGVFLTYSLMALLLPWMGVDMSVVFGEQLHLDAMARSYDTQCCSGGNCYSQTRCEACGGDWTLIKGGGASYFS